jgi:hypothetical protein
VRVDHGILQSQQTLANSEKRLANRWLRVAPPEPTLDTEFAAIRIRQAQGRKVGSPAMPGITTKARTASIELAACLAVHLLKATEYQWGNAAHDVACRGHFSFAPFGLKDADSTFLP